MSGKSVTEENLAEFINELDSSRAAVLVCAQALDEADARTDLELQSAAMLNKAFETMDGTISLSPFGSTWSPSDGTGSREPPVGGVPSARGGSASPHAPSPDVDRRH